MESTYYKKIVYKKNAFEDLKTYIKMNFGNKNILLVSTKSVPAEDVTSVLNALFTGTDNVGHFVARCNFDAREIGALGDKITQFNPSVIIALGGGKCADVVKYYSFNYSIPYISCPTTATSLAHFSNYCINPLDPTKSFYANMPNKIFIQEGLIKNSSCLNNINGLCFLHSLRAMFVEGILVDDERQKYIFVGLEKLFNKLDDEQTSILLCNEDSNLVLMDLFIDFGYFIGLLKKEDYYIFNMFQILEKMNRNLHSFKGKDMLICSKSILSIFKQYLELNTLKVFEKNNYNRLSEFLENYNIKYKILKNNKFFNDFGQKVHLKRIFLSKRKDLYGEICNQILSISSFSKKVKSVYKYGIEIDCTYDDVLNSLSLTPFVYEGTSLVDFIAGSGILNSFVL